MEKVNRILRDVEFRREIQPAICDLFLLDDHVIIVVENVLSFRHMTFPL